MGAVFIRMSADDRHDAPASARHGAQVAHRRHLGLDVEDVVQLHSRASVSPPLPPLPLAGRGDSQ